ncbi:sarcosine oxidase subunit alpha family protein [Oharaeibacter diazotrophicus]|uniref:Sarcosine oxidase subunit alpha n=1 Tax=Oharaeibacter diazotrophicus TaxID=1920512 RepID=A0A4V3CW76_9HYPH|nr:sarcosine oxidase subunit alpha family protein [Oharaeibacter diazotrophicus]TDP85218.1 sarcosine oxidase subunit alpha [Oharaeibacter diazotrophicus]BBE74188.1 aminomethyltransferase [Pleomorphomonas sp. SM30]GLS76124.1 sarcosine oxidase subunit alpha [Oharaeibacter diazotrophicus]
MTAPFRLASGGRIDRARPLAFTFDGKRYEGFAGDTLASALIANGVHLLGRSFKYHRPRGILTAGVDEPNALVGVGADEAHYTPNLRAPAVELHDGLVAESQNRWPSLAFDVGAINDRLGRFLPAGFYYKTFMWPRTFWTKVYEPKIRAAAGLGRAPTAADAARYTQVNDHVDVLVVGAGPAGLAAALAASGSGLSVMLVDEQPECGGSLLHDLGATIDGRPAATWVAETVATLKAAGVEVLTRATAFAYSPHNMIGVVERLTDHLKDPDPRLPRERMRHVRAREVVLATGSIERPLVFPDNDRPGVMLADAARAYANRWAAKPGRRAVIATAHDGAYRAALDLSAAGVEIAMIADLRPNPAGPLVDAARAAGLRVEAGAVVTGTRGRLRLGEVHVARLGAGGAVSAPEPVAADLLAMSGGWTPTVHLFSQSRGKLRFDDALQAYVPGTSVERERSAGACRGVYGLAAVLDDGYCAGASAVSAIRGGAVLGKGFTVSADAPGTGGTLGALPHGRNPSSVKAFVDYQNDVTAKDVALATREGLRSIEHVKRYTTTGMATDQGKTSNMNALGIVSEALGLPIPTVGLTTFRPPYTPVTFGAFAGGSRGELFDPVRRTPSHDWAAAAGAAFEPVGQWMRAWYFPKAGEDMHAAVDREVKAIRTSVGLFDASTLGKIEVVGPDAAAFMELMYTNAWAKLGVGRCRYGVMLREDGFVMDDGVVGRLAADRFHVTTTTGGAPRVLQHMEDYLQTEFPHLDVWLTSTTEQWAVIAVQGPKAREVIAPFVEGVDLGNEAFPHMSVRECRFAGVPCRLFRVSFTGELGYEINVPADYGRAVWEAVYEAGKAHGITPYGTEAMHVARAEKGYIIVGQETDGTQTPDDVGLAWAVGKNKPDFVGKRALARPAMVAAGRKQMVGLLTKDPAVVLEEGAQIVATRDYEIPAKMIGHVTSSYRSATLGRSIAIAVVKAGRSKIGESVFVPMPDGVIEATVVDPVFYDKEGKRLDG